MRLPQFALFVSATILCIGCSGGGECARAFDKALECSDKPESKKSEVRKFREESISACNKSKSKPVVNAAIKCSLIDSCDGFADCISTERAKVTIKTIDGYLNDGNLRKAMLKCQHNKKFYEESATFKASCENVFRLALDDSNLRLTVCSMLGWKNVSSILSESCTRYNPIP